MTKINPEQFVSENITRLKLPDTVSRLNQPCNDSVTNIAEVEAIINTQPEFATKLLRYTNTPLCEPRQNTSTISEAIGILGIKQLRDLTLTIALLECSEAAIDVNLVSIEKFWRHSLYCAISSRTIAQHTGMPDYKDLFLMGLLHDIGKLLMYLSLPKQSNAFIEKNINGSQQRTSLEEEVYGFDHIEVGHLILKHWQLPEKINAAVTHHHKPGAAGDYAQHASIIYVAEGISNAYAPLVYEDGQVSIDPDKAAEILDIDSAELKVITQAIDKEFITVEKLLFSDLLNAR